MRVTQRVMVNNYLHNLNKNYIQMGKLQQQLATGHKVSKPSDNPFVVTRTMELNASIAANERYKQNIEEAIGWTDTQEMALGQMNDVLQKVRELTNSGSTGTNSDSDKMAITAQLKQLREQLVEIANTSYDGRYVFSGQKTTTKPFEIVGNDVKYEGSTEGLSKELASGINMDIGISGQDFFKAKYTDASSTTTGTDTTGIFATIDKIVKSIETPNNESETSKLIGTLDANMENMSTIRSECGARQKRLDAMHEKNTAETFNMTGLLSKTYDIDLAETYTEAKVLESIYQASLNVGARVLQPSILDFLR